MIKTIFNDGEYYFTISQFELQDKVLVLNFTCDVGVKGGQTINVPFPTSNTSRIQRLCESINYEPFGSPTEPNYGEQFVGLRVKASVRILTENIVLRNIVTNFGLADAPADIDVLAEKPTDQYFVKTNKKRLPILNA